MKQSEYNNSINSNQLTSKCLLFLILAMVTGPLTALPVLAICKSWKNSIFLSYVVSIITVVITAFINLVRSFGDSIVFMFEIIFLIIGYTIYWIAAGMVVQKKQTKKVLIGALIATSVSFAAALILLVIKSSDYSGGGSSVNNMTFDNMLGVVTYICKYINPVLCICTLLSLNTRCSKCGFINRGGAKFCGGCGNSL